MLSSAAGRPSALENTNDGFGGQLSGEERSTPPEGDGSGCGAPARDAAAPEGDSGPVVTSGDNRLPSLLWARVLKLEAVGAVGDVRGSATSAAARGFVAVLSCAVHVPCGWVLMDRIDDADRFMFVADTFFRYKCSGDVVLVDALLPILDPCCRGRQLRR